MRHNRSSPMLLTLTSVAILLGLSATKVFAQGVGPQLIPDSGTIGNCSFVTGDFHFDCIPLYLAYLTRLAFGMAGGFALFQIVQGGYEYAISGLPTGIIDKESAKKRITHSLLGLVVVIFAYLIVDTIISAIFGL